MTTTKTFVMTPQELCAKLGIAYSTSALYYMVGNSLVCSDDTGSFRNTYAHSWTAILSLGDPFPLDECKKCDGTKEGHSVAGYCLRWLHNQDSTDTYPDMRRFEPKTATVSGLRILPETCKGCGHDHKRSGRCYAILRDHEKEIEWDCECKKFEPEQRIGVRVKV